MIVPMQKVFVAAARHSRDDLLEALRNLGVLHLQPTDPDRAVPDEKTAGQLDALGRALQVLGNVEPTGSAPDLEPLDAAREVQDLQRRSVEAQNRLTALYRQLQQIAQWGDLQLEQVRRLRQCGLEVLFAVVPQSDVPQVEAELVEGVGELSCNRVMVGIVRRDGEDAEAVMLPETGEWLDLPDRDAPDLRAEAEQIDKQLSEDNRRLAELANLLPSMRQAHAAARQQADWVVARRGGLEEDRLFAVQGWCPAEHADTLAADLAGEGVAAAVQAMQPEDDEQPPTLLRYPRWARPIKTLFDVLGSIPGYREYDLSPFFFFAMPVFTAMLIGDAGYGLIFTLFGLLGYGKLAGKAGKPAPQMILLFGLTTLAWGVLTGNYFGVAPAGMIDAGGFWASLGSALQPLAVLWRADEEAARNIVIKISFTLGAIHLILAHLRQVVGYFPSKPFLAEVGWCAILAGVYGLIWNLFFKPDLIMGWGLVQILAAAGFLLVVLFTYPDKKLPARLGLGIVANLMPTISTFSDTMSYIRLMAVGLASYYIAMAFNGLAVDVAGGSVWAIPVAVLIVVFAHSLNIILGLIAIFAHGVRLNMLEFSSNAGVQWSGYPYAPFALQTTGSKGE